jgi:isoquinoline 1-oxidoreductase beta subunit
MLPPRKPDTMRKPIELNVARRKFLRQSSALGAGLVVGFHWPRAAAQGKALAGTEVNAWVVVNPDDTVVIRVAHSEMGQGSFTGLMMLVAEELECDWAKTRGEYASPNEHIRRKRIWGNMATSASRAIRSSQAHLRRAGATAREMLVAAAAQAWDVPPAECTVAAGVITHAASNRRATYGQVATAAGRLAPLQNVTLKRPQDWRLIGKPVPRVDIPDKVLGKPVFGIDVDLPGMVYAAVAQCPVFGGKLISAQTAQAQRMRGVLKVVTLEDAVAVIADNWWRAQQALDTVKLEWDAGANANTSSASIKEFLRAGIAGNNLKVPRRDGDVGAAFVSAAKVIDAEYYAPYLNHATLEPQVLTALVEDGRVEVWASTQSAEATLHAAAQTAGVPPLNVEVHKMQLGGGFGRRASAQDFTRLGVKIAMQFPGKPVKMLWTRAEDMQHDYYRPAAMVHHKAALDAAGNPVAWQTKIACPSILALHFPERIKNGVDQHAVDAFVDLPYAIPNVQIEYAMQQSHVPVGFWRAVGHSQNAFFRESFVDELAHAAGRDPYAFRRALLQKHPKELALLDAVAKAAGWGTPPPPGVYRGIAVQDAYDGYTAAVVEASVTDAGALEIKRVIVAADPGYIVNPDSATAQVEGCVVFGLTAALYGEITLKNGRVEQASFADYPMMRMREMPKVEVLLLPSGGTWGGMGQATLAPVAPALCNAIFAATGKRIRSLPLKHHDLTPARPKNPAPA